MTTKTVMCRWRKNVSQRILGAVGFFYAVKLRAMISCTSRNRSLVLSWNGMVTFERKGSVARQRHYQILFRWQEAVRLRHAVLWDIMATFTRLWKLAMTATVLWHLTRSWRSGQKPSSSGLTAVSLFTVDNQAFISINAFYSFPISPAIFEQEYFISFILRADLSLSRASLFARFVLRSRSMTFLHPSSFTLPLHL